MNLVVATVAGEEVCRLSSRRDSTLGDFVVAMQHALGKPLDDGHVLIQGTRILGDCTGGEDCRPFLGAALVEGEELQLTLLLQQRPAVRKALSEIADSQRPRRDRVRALKTLRSEARRGDAETVEALVALVRDEKCSLIRREAVGALQAVAKDDDQRALDAWVALSEHPDLDVQKCAVQALFRQRQKAAAEDSD